MTTLQQTPRTDSPNPAPARPPLGRRLTAALSTALLGRRLTAALSTALLVTAGLTLTPVSPESAATATVSNLAALAAELTTGETITLANGFDTTGTGPIAVPPGISVTLDLNGQTLTVTGAPGRAAIGVPDGASLAITDTSTANTPTGQHHIVFIDEAGAEHRSAAITVTAATSTPLPPASKPAPQAPSTPSAPAASTGLAATGPNPALPLGLATVLLLAGAAVADTRRNTPSLTRPSLGRRG